MQSTQQRMISALTSVAAKDWHAMGVKRPLFDTDPEAVKMFDYMSNFIRENGKTPSLETINEKFNAQLESEAVEPQFLMLKLVEARIRRKLAIITNDLKQAAQTDPVKALAELTDQCMALRSEMTNSQIGDFKNAIEEAWPHLVAKWSGQVPSVPLFWPTLQSQMGGVQGGEVVSFIGRPGMGKTWLMLSAAMHVWETLNKPVVFVSMEIMRRNIQTRAASIYTHTPADWFKHGDTPTIFGQNKKLKIQKLLKELSNSDKPSFWVVDGNLTATTDELIDVCRAHEPAAVFIDGAYMLKLPNQRGMKGHERIEEVTTVLKRDIATNMDLPVFASWQFNREATKLKKDSTPSLEHIAGGDYIGFISSVILGLLDEPAAVEGNAKHAGRRRLHVLKGRDGETGEMVLKWDFATMDFSEIENIDKVQKETYGMDD